jgi:8-oxo-dGTP pyrophosphatase MutT (NUDIX family)
MEKRDPLLQQLLTYKGFDENEEQMRLEMVEFIQSNPDCFERSLKIGHMVGGAWVVDETKQFALLTHHRKFDRWLQLGGHADGESNMYQVALREAQEESGLKSIQSIDQNIFDIDIHTIPVRGDEPEHKHYEIRYLFTADMNEKVIVSNESKDVRWVKLDEILQLSKDISIKRLITKTVQLASV